MCEYCLDDNDKRKFLDRNKDLWIWKENNRRELLVMDGNSEEIEIKFCPMCGRNLNIEYGFITDEELDSYAKFTEHEKKIIKEMYATHKRGTFPNPRCALY